MRITNNIIHLQALTGVQRNLKALAEAQGQVSSGLRLQRASDDPVAAGSTMRARGSIRALDQYRKSIDVAKLRSSTEETALHELSNLLVRAKELGVSQGTDTANAATREQARIEVEHLLRHAVSLGNTRLDGSYVFGGTAGAQPYDVDDSGPTLDFTSTDPTGARAVEVSPHTTVATNHSGLEVFGTTTSGVFASLRDLAVAFKAGNVADIRNALTDIDGSLDTVQRMISETGARYNQLEVTGSNLDALETNLLTLKSDLEEVDIEKAVTTLMSRQTAYQAAMLATSRVMGLTLTDYLR